MKEFTSFEISENTFKKINESKDSMGFAKKSWDDWFNSLLSISNDDKSDKNTIEQIIRKNASNSWYKQWVRNFAINLPHIWKDPSAIELAKTRNSDSSALVIGRGPSIVKHNHLELLAKSDFKGAIICADGNLLNVLEAGITPDKFNLFVVTIDAQENQKKCYEHELIKKFGNGIKCIFSTTAHPQAYLAAKNAGLQVYWIHTLFDFEEGKKSFNQIQGIMSRAQNNEKKIPAIQTGANVGTSSWVIGWSILKCNHIGLIGLDLGYDDTDNQEVYIDDAPEVFTSKSTIKKIIDKSLKKKKRLHIKHIKEDNGEETEREISPQKLFKYKNSNYLQTYCHLRKAERSFKVKSIYEASILEKKMFKPKRLKTWKTDFERWYIKK